MPSGAVVQNFHSGGKKRTAICRQAAEAFANVFQNQMWVDSLDSKPNAGNAILLATNSCSNYSLKETVCRNALVVQVKYGLRFDAPSRVKGLA